MMYHSNSLTKKPTQVSIKGLRIDFSEGMGTKKIKMDKEIDILELFSGIGGFTKGLSDAGFIIKNHYFSEIDKHAIANYKYNFPNAEYIGSVTNVSNWAIERPTVITFGSPCQDFSLAGKRSGLEGSKSSLIQFAIMSIERFRPDFFIWENVKGAYSTNDSADYWAIIQAFTNINGYRLEQQLLNTAWVLPQNRERIYIIGHLTRRSEPRVFPIGEGMQEVDGVQGHRSNTITARYYGAQAGGGYVLKDKQLPQEVIVKSNTELGFDVARVGDSINYSNPNSKTRRGRVGVGVGVAQTLDTQVNQAVIVAQRGRGESGNIKQQFEQRNDGKTNTLTGVQKDNLVIQIGTLKDSGGQQPYQQDRVYDPNGLSPTLDSRSEQKNVFINDHSFKSRDNRIYKDVAPTIKENSNRNINVSNIRRLTEIECERLQGFPDNWTEYGIYERQIWINKKLKTFEIVEEKHKIPKSQRYKLIGNAVTRDIVEMIGKRLLNNP